MSDAGSSPTFVCAACGGTFPREWSEEAARAEAEANFPGLFDSGEAIDMICDACYEKPGVLPFVGADWAASRPTE